jgi:hypothetical protein
LISNILRFINNNSPPLAVGGDQGEGGLKDQVFLSAFTLALPHRRGRGLLGKFQILQIRRESTIVAMIRRLK